MKLRTKRALTSIAALLVNAFAFADSPHWTYDEQNQPGGWGAITGTGTPAPMNYPYAECAIGANQAPVDIAGVEVTPIINTLAFKWPSFKADFFNTGHAIEVLPSSTSYFGTTKVGKDVYPWIQAHLHAPAEHTINGQTFAAEMHFVHIRNDGRMIVVGLMIERGAANGEIQKMLDNTPNTPGTATHNQTTIPFDPSKILPKAAKKFYTYAGSLTTPPCTEGVNWYVYSSPISMSEAQLDALRGFYEGNNRNLQSLNGKQPVTNKK